MREARHHSSLTCRNISINFKKTTHETSSDCRSFWSCRSVSALNFFLPSLSACYKQYRTAPARHFLHRGNHWLTDRSVLHVFSCEQQELKEGCSQSDKAGVKELAGLFFCSWLLDCFR